MAEEAKRRSKEDAAVEKRIVQTFEKHLEQGKGWGKKWFEYATHGAPLFQNLFSPFEVSPSQYHLNYRIHSYLLRDSPK